jgi:PAS domain S-box-containing protein
MLMPESTNSIRHNECLTDLLSPRMKTVRELQRDNSCGISFTHSETKIINEFSDILRDLSAEEAEKERMLAILTSAVDPIVQIDGKGVIQFVNPACCTVFQYQTNDLLGQNVSILMPEPHSQLHDSYLNNYITTGERKVLGVGRKLRGRRSDGSLFSLFLTLSEAKIHGVVLFTGIMRDLSMEEAEHERMLAILTSAVDPIVQIDHQGVIQFINPACCKTFQYAEQDLLGQNVSLLMPQPHAKLHDSYLKNYATSGTKKVIGIGRKLRGRRKDGTTFSLYLTVSEAKIDNKLFFTGILRDLSNEEAEYERMMSILTSAVDPIVQINAKGMMQVVNQACCSVFRYHEGELIGKNVKILMPEPHSQLHDSYLENYIRTGVKKVLGIGRQLRGRRSDGSTFSIYLTLSEAKIGSEVFFTGIMRDQSAEEREHEKSEALLRNIFPEDIVKRMKDVHVDSHIADYHEDVTILFADVVGFTKFSSSKSPIDVVKFLNKIFRGFDSLADKFGLEKIKTIGDAYMVVSGLQMEKNHTLNMLNFALEVIDQINEMNVDNPNEEDVVSIRIGINSGSVVAGVVGTKKRFFDLWGDAVNVSARMESNGIENCIQCTERIAKVAMLHPKKFSVIERGLINVKGKGEMRVYLIGHADTLGLLHALINTVS